MTEQEELELIKKNSPYALPDNPAESGWSTAQIKEKFYAGLIVIYNLFKESRTSQNNNITNITSLVNTINEQYEGIINNQTLKVKYDSESNEIVTTYAKIVDLVSGNVAALKYLKSDGATSEFIYKIEQDLAQLTTNFNLVKNWADNLKSVNSQEAVQRAVRATQDDLGNIIRNTYATVANLTSLSTTVTNIINGTLIVDKAAKDASGNSISATYATKVENALKVAYTDIVNALNDTSTNKPLSAAKGKELQDQITAIQTLLASNDTDLDQLQEIVAYIKNNKSLIDGITTNKINYTDIVDNLTSQISNKPLSANQGYVLKGMIDMLHQTIAPDTTDIYDLGTSTQYYKDIYFKGDLKDGTNSISVADIAQAMVDILGLQNDTPSNLALLKTYTQSNTDLADSVSKKHSHSNKALLDDYNQTNDNIADAVDKKHSHTNKAVLDGIDAAKVADWNDKYTQAQTDTKVANAVNIAKGKTASYVIELADNPSFNSTSDSITLSDSLTLTCVDGTTVTLGDLKDGDNILITDVNVPDRWVAQITTSGQTKVYMMAALETRVVDLTPYAAVDTTSTANSGDVLLYNSSTHKMEKCPNGTYIVKNGKLSALVTDEISDTNQSNKFVNANEKAYVNEHTLNSLNELDLSNKVRANGFYGGLLQWVSNSDYDVYAIYLKAGSHTLSSTINAYGSVVLSNNNYERISNLISEKPFTANIAYTFTLSADSYVLFSLEKAKLSYLMLNKGSEAQTYQPYNRNEHITNDEATLLKQEWKKGLNLFDLNDIGIEVGTFNPQTGVETSATNRVRTKKYLSLNAGTYTISYSGNVSKVVVYIYNTSGIWQQNESILSWQTGACTFTVGYNFKVRFGFANENDTDVSTSDVSNIMLVEDTHAYPYEEYNGAIVREKILNYSTTEVNTGFTWINGKTIYKKSFVLNELSLTNTYQKILNNSEGMTYIIKFEAVFYSGSGVYSDSECAIGVRSDGIYFKYNDTWNPSVSYFTFWYIK